MIILSLNVEAKFCDEIGCKKLDPSCSGSFCADNEHICRCWITQPNGAPICNYKLTKCPEGSVCLNAGCVYNCVRIAGVDYCCGEQDNVCPEDFEDSEGNRIDCDLFGGDVDCEAITECKIIDAGITLECNGPGGTCQDNVDRIKLEVVVEDTTKCKNINKIEIDAFTNIPNGCNKVTMSAYPGPPQSMNGVTGKYTGYWTVKAPQGCEGKTMEAVRSALYNWTGGNYNLIVAGPATGTFQFAGEAPSTDCKINDANIKTYCGAEGCDNGDKIQLNISVEDYTKCQALSVNKMQIDASSSAQQQPTGMVIGGSLCNIYMVNSSIVRTDNTYLGNWTIIVPAGCEGENVKANIARLFNDTSQISYLRRDFGSFTFVEEPTNWYILEDLSVSPSVFVLNITHTQQLEVIALMKWIENNTYFTKDVTQQANYDSNNTNVASVTSSGLVTGNGIGTANITSEYTHYGMTKEDYSIVNVRSFANDYIRYINLALNKYEIKVNEETNYEVKAYWSNGATTTITSESDVQSLNPSVASVQNYRVKGESQGNTIISANYTHNNLPYRDETFVIVSEEVPSGCSCSCIGSPGYNICGYCCNATHRCVDVGGAGQLVACPANEPDCVNGNVCVENGQLYCHDIKFESPCIAAHPTCYWDLQPTDLCKHCIEDDPGSCSGYDNVIACEADPCGEKYTGCPSGSTCECMWDDSLKECYLNVQQQGAGNICCEYSVSFGECGVCEGQTNSRRRTTICTGPCQSGDQCSMTTYEHCALTGYEASMEDCQSCAVLFRPMPFFSWFNILAVVSLLIVFYLFMFRKKKL